MQLDSFDISKYGLTEEELQMTMSSYTPLNLKANEFFLKEGEICNYIAIVKDGLLRSYFYDDHANEITTEFYAEGSLIVSFDSFNDRLPAEENIKAIVDTELMVVSFERQKELYELVPAWNRICKDLADVANSEMLERTRRFQVLSATERYQKFCKENPGVLQRATLGHIASFIGVDIATLSRIRKKK